MTVLQSDLEQIRKKYRVPALAAAANIKGELCEIAAVGSRVVGGKERVTDNDKWHIGSCTKPMTSTLAGILIERGQLDWTTTIADTFEDWCHEIHDGWHRATLEQLLSHHGGAPENWPEWKRDWKEKRVAPTEQRLEFVRSVLLQPPVTVPGSKFLYSNSGYAIAGLMIEISTKRDWEGLIDETVFRPLGMISAGFGTPGTRSMTDQPRGHARVNRKLRPVEADGGWDSPPAVGPGATVHCSIGDLLRFAASHAEGALVGNNTLQRLHRRYGASEYSPGWYVVQREWGGGHVVSHDGSNWGWYASMWIAPFKNASFVAATNATAPAGQQACWQAINHMIGRLIR